VRFWKWFFLLLGPLLLGLFIGVMLMVAYPNILKLGASMCPDEKPDAFVVRYTVSTSDGTGTNFTLYCMSERGEIEEVGTWLPLLVVCGYVVAGLYAVVFLFVVIGMVRRISGGGSDPPTDGANVYLRPDPVVGQPAPAPPPFE
jgi:hypothetical protein